MQKPSVDTVPVICYAGVTMNYEWTDLVGNLGVFIILFTYLLLQTGRIKSESLNYSAYNLLGAGMIAFSLTYNFNLSAFIVEIFWIAISLYGIFRHISKR